MTTMHTPGEYRKLKAERDALLEAAKRLEELGFDDRLYSDEDDVAWDNLVAAIDKAGGDA